MKRKLDKQKIIYDIIKLDYPEELNQVYTKLLISELQYNILDFSLLENKKDFGINLCINVLFASSASMTIKDYLYSKEWIYLKNKKITEAIKNF